MTGADTPALMGTTERTKSVDDKTAERIRNFLRRVVFAWFPDPTKKNGVNQTDAAKALRISQGYISDLFNKDKEHKKPGLALVLRLREATGASFEEIARQGQVPTAIAGAYARPRSGKGVRREGIVSNRR
jgi:transcriptional regulator with XRE-family HTH domain